MRSCPRTEEREKAPGTDIACRPGMRPVVPCLLVSAAAGLCAACQPHAHAHGLAVGEPVPSRAFDCELTYERVAPPEAQPQWRQVGQVCVSAKYSLSRQEARSFDMVYQPGEMHDVLAAKACAFGGEMVAPLGGCSNGLFNAIAFGVYVGQ
jgi:hypothetical protein